MGGGERLDSLKRSLELAKEQLKIVDGDIKRITGRDPNEDRNLKRTAPKPVVNRTKSAAFNDNFNDFESSYQSKKISDEDFEVSIASSVVRVADTRSRLDVAKNLKSTDKERGRRMFNMLQGTLKQFQTESASNTLKPQMEKRRNVDARLDARFIEEKEASRRERMELFRARREQTFEVTLLKEKLQIVSEFESWKEDRKKMKGFCQTKHRPHIFFRPKVHNHESKWLLEIANENIETMISTRENDIEQFLEEMAQSRRRMMQNYLNNMNNRDGNKDNSNNSTRPHHSPPARRSVDLDNNSWSSPPLTKVPKLSSHVVVTTNNSQHDDKRDLESGELSDASETFGIGGADEPQIMEGGMEEHDGVQSESSTTTDGEDDEGARKADVADEKEANDEMAPTPQEVVSNLETTSS